MMYDQLEREKKLIEYYQTAPKSEQEFIVESLISYMLTRAEADNHANKLMEKAETGKNPTRNYYSELMPIWAYKALGLEDEIT